MLINKKLATAIATGAILMNTLVPAAFAQGTAAGVLNNGAESTNTVNVTQNNTSTATQNNTATVTNDVHATATTGSNNANFNTNGTNEIKTGAASSSVDISNAANDNVMNQGGSNAGGNALVQDSGNGAFSTNNANLTTNNNSFAAQNNAANFTNNVDSHASTGKNSGSDNTGGDTSIMTGAASNGVQIINAANKNILTGGNGAFGNGGDTTLKVTDNGALSNNTVNDAANNNAVATQTNAAAFANTISGGAATGKNTGDFNTEGSTFIKTGNAENMTGIANMANANVIDALGCGCDTTAGDLFKVGDNGSFSGNTVNAVANNNNATAQNNAAEFANAADTHAFTGDNSDSDATGSYFFGGMQGVDTGASYSQTQVSNTSNQNGISANDMNFGGMTFTWNPTAFMGGWFGM